MDTKRLALIAIAISCISLIVSSFGIFNRKALPSFTVTDSTLHIWNGKTVDGEDAVCINGFAYHKDLIFDDRLLVPMTGVRADERGPGPGAVPLRAVRCNRL